MAVSVRVVVLTMPRFITAIDRKGCTIDLHSIHCQQGWMGRTEDCSSMTEQRSGASCRRGGFARLTVAEAAVVQLPEDGQIHEARSFSYNRGVRVLPRSTTRNAVPGGAASF